MAQTGDYSLWQIISFNEKQTLHTPNSYRFKFGIGAYIRSSVSELLYSQTASSRAYAYHRYRYGTRKSL